VTVLSNNHAITVGIVGFLDGVKLGLELSELAGKLLVVLYGLLAAVKIFLSGGDSVGNLIILTVKFSQDARNRITALDTTCGLVAAHQLDIQCRKTLLYTYCTLAVVILLSRNRQSVDVHDFVTESINCGICLGKLIGGHGLAQNLCVVERYLSLLQQNAQNILFIVLDKAILGIELVQRICIGSVNLTLVGEQRCLVGLGIEFLECCDQILYGSERPVGATGNGSCERLQSVKIKVDLCKIGCIFIKLCLIGLVVVESLLLLVYQSLGGGKNLVQLIRVGLQVLDQFLVRCSCAIELGCGVYIFSQFGTRLIILVNDLIELCGKITKGL